MTKLQDIILTDKIKYILSPDYNPRMIIMGGSTRTFKSKILMIKLYFLVMQMKSDAFICVSNNDRFARDFVNSDFSIVDLFPNVEFKVGYGQRSGSRLEVTLPDGIIKNIYVASYSNKSDHEKKILGTSIPIIAIDELSAAHPNFITECVERTTTNSGVLLASTNGATPSSYMYENIIDKCTVDPMFINDIPNEERILINGTEPNWKYIHFSLATNDAPHFSESQLSEITNLYKPGSFRYKSKIRGIRAAATGVIFDSDHIRECIRPVTDKDLRNIHINTIGIDTAYSIKSADSHAMCSSTLTNDGYLIIGKNKTWKYNNRDGNSILASDLATRIAREYNTHRGNIFIDNADANLILTTKRLYGHLPVAGSYKKFGISARIKLIIDLLAHGKLIIDPSNKELITELENVAYSDKPGSEQWAEDSENHLLDAFCYSFTPYVSILQSQLTNKRRSY